MPQASLQIQSEAQILELEQQDTHTTDPSPKIFVRARLRV